MLRRTSFTWPALAASASLLAACNGDDGPRPPSTLAAITSTSLTGIVGELASSPLTVKVADDRGGNLGGIIVTFSVAAGGGTVTPAVDTTDGSGTATTSWRFGGTAGEQRVTATVTGVATPVNFVAATIAGAPATVAIQGGDNQSAATNTAVATAPSVIVRDRFNNPVNATSVFFSVSSGGGSVSGAGAVTNPTGVATVGSWTLGPAVGANRLTALVVANGVTSNPVTFNATATAGAAASVSATSATTLSAVVGALVTPVPTIRVLDANGNPVAGVNVTFTASNGSTVVGGSKTTNLSGIASPDGWQMGATVGTFTLSATVGSLTPVVFTSTALNAAPAALSIVAGNNQTATVGRTLPIDPAVRITDAFGNPIVGQEVVFEVISGGGSAVVRRPLTDANGTATVGAWTLGETPGTNTLRATATGLTLGSNPVTFTATATAGAASSLSIVAGNNQTATAFSTVAVNPSVVVRDNRGNPVQGVTVTFAPSAGGAVTGGSAITNAAGVATVGSWKLSAVAGPQTLTATLAGVANVIFQATATAGAATAVQVVGDSVLPAFPVFSFVSPLPTLRVVDANGNPVAGASVTFEVVTGAGNTLTGATKTTGNDGLAQITTWRIGTVAGVYRIRAVVSGLALNGAEPTWLVTGTALTAAQVTVASTSLATQTGSQNTAVPTVPVVRVVDQFGNPVSGVSVTFTVAAGNGTIAGGFTTFAVATDGLGFASVGSWVLPAGTTVTRTLTATVTGNGITGNPITFTANVP
ncbi:beta strand repeat-containing protein [Gemmatimonas sp.]|jgi:adhesin/invasin|uniref:beta strand repeat-containing protein n=1 Tax=Gemmatimonas sp. TaxID=1962908 RepID=UPI0037C1AFF6